MLALWDCGVALAVKLPEGFTETALVTGINDATAMDFAPDGRLFICEQTGGLRVVKNDVLLPRPFLTVKVDSSWERGLLGVAFDPHFDKNNYVYVNYISPDPYPHHRISRFTADGKGHDHNSKGFSMRLAGGGVKGGIVHGATDEFGGTAVEKKVHVHDLHATILHLLGIDHERLTFRYSGRDFRLTDVHGEVVRDILV
jgi:hypothetical protein